MWLVLLGCSHPAPSASVDHLTAAEVEEATRRLTDLGPRLVATPAEDAARDAVVAMLTEAGLSVETDPFVWDAWQPGTASVTVDGVTYDADALSPAPTTVALTAPMVRSGDLHGKIALLSSNDGSRAEEYLTAATGGAAGLVRISEDLDYDGSPLVEVGHTLAGSKLPCVAVDKPTGHALEAASGAARIDIAANVVAGHTSYNVVARIPGRDPAPVFVIAHYDSWNLSESAFDNALGVGALVVLARQAAEGPEPAHDLVFLSTSGEEQGLQGSLAWVAANPDLATSAVLVINIDVLWSNEGDFYIEATSDDLRTAGIGYAAAEGLDGLDGGQPGLASDHVPFVGRGAPAIWTSRWRDRHYHTDDDTTTWLDWEQAAAAVRVQWHYLAAAATLPDQR